MVASGKGKAIISYRWLGQDEAYTVVLITTKLKRQVLYMTNRLAKVLGGESSLSHSFLRKEKKMKEYEFEAKVCYWAFIGFLACMIIGVLAGCEKKENETITSPTFNANVSAYCKCSLCCQEFADGITASGKPAVGFLVAAPKNIPFGTLLSIPGYAGKPVEVLDRGSAIQGNRLDVFFEDKDDISGHQRALNWGRQYLTVKIITEVK